MMSCDDEAPDFSVIMIFHNEERFLADAVGSVASQVGPSWELILVDDGSTDQSGDIARTLAAAFPRWIRCLAHPDGANKGMSASRNLGLASARGRWITFLDADDTWSAGKLAAQLDALARHGDAKVLVSPACWWRSWDPDADQQDWVQDLVAAVTPPTSDTEPEQVVGSTVVDPPDLVAAFLRDEWNSICDMVVHRDVIAEVGGYEPTFTAMFEDQVFHTKVLCRHAAVVTRESWYLYRQHDAACTATAHAAGGHTGARREFLDWAVRHVTSVDRPATATVAGWRAFIDTVQRRRRQTRVRMFRDRLPSRPVWLR